MREKLYRGYVHNCTLHGSESWLSEEKDWTSASVGKDEMLKWLTGPRVMS